MIGNAKWYLGAGPESYSSLTAADFYGYERGTTTGKQCTSGSLCNDTVTRTTSWTGQIGLMYPSDYGYSANIENEDGCKTLEVEKSENGLVKVLVEEEDFGTIHVWYDGTMMQKISYVISAISYLIVVIYLVIKILRDKNLRK